MNWRMHAGCQGANPELFFSTHPVDIILAKDICSLCPVTTDCLIDGLKRDRQAYGRPVGIWGGLTGDERLNLRRKSAARLANQL